MKSLLKKLNDNPYWIFIIAIPSVFEIVKLIKSVIKMNTIIENYRYYDWVNPLIQLIVVVLLYSTMKQNKLLKKKLISDTQSLDKKIADWNTIVTTQISDFNSKFEEYKQSKGSIDSMMMKDYSTSLRAIVAYLNSLHSPEDVQKIASILFNAKIVIPDCERIGFSPAIIAFMKKEFYAEKHDEQLGIINSIYPAKNEQTDEEKKE